MHSTPFCPQSYDTFKQFLEAEVGKSPPYHACLIHVDSVPEYISVIHLLSINRSLQLLVHFYSICPQFDVTPEQFHEAQVDKSLPYHTCLVHADGVSQCMSVSNGLDDRLCMATHA